ncbi:sensor histidine kinase [Nonomuraea roseola]|uniref:histidine kinase n=1 Tax=Nonomuraea roseola TaxID=46179 RepID=A0ABV5PP91_9ACTN
MGDIAGYLATLLLHTVIDALGSALILAVALLVHRRRSGRHRGPILAERRRIARDLHDGVGHGLTVIALHARHLGAASTSAGHAAEIIDQTAQATLDDLRAILGTLRDTSAAKPVERKTESDSVEPLSSRVVQLATRLPTGTTTLRLDNLAAERTFPSDITHTAFRIAQESLTNALKYGADRIELSLSYADDLCVEVVSRGWRRSAAAWSRSGGHGLKGLRERVEEHRGSLVHDHHADGSFVVRAVIPRQPGKAGICELSAS